MLLLRTLLFLALAIGIVNVAQAQGERPGRPKQTSNRPTREKTRGNNDPDIMMGSPEAEMLMRQDIKAAEKDYEENLDRAREAAQLSTEIRDTYLHHKAFGRIEQKKLERLEKVTRKIRSEAGGSDGDVTLEDTPTQIEPALMRLAEVSEKMRKVVEKTPRHVVSTAVIERANEMLEIIRYIRTFTR
jgi:vacuolar-type H+-ATPase subunit I/STV1